MPQQKTIKDQIGLLIRLQVVDGEIYILNREKQDMPGHIKSIEESLENKKTGIKQAEQSLKNVQVKLKEKEISLQQKEENIKKLQNQLYQIKTNKEYAAMLKEIEGLKADNSLIEEEMLRLMDEIEVAKKKIAEEKELFKKEEGAAQKEKDRVDVRAKEIEARSKDLSWQRNEIVPNIDKQLLAKYERVLKNKDGLAIVRIENSACGGCHMNLPPQVVSESKLKEEIVTCGSCNRILYVDDNVEIN
ncbi:MAG: hypothetical protein KKG21_03850 [Candidatus Omnitrophica bacterium]|nr:hypothetical protein [Candidatus Omnitrophota bacterium]